MRASALSFGLTAAEAATVVAYALASVSCTLAAEVSRRSAGPEYL